MSVLNTSDDFSLSLESLDAYIDSFDEGPEIALKRLEGLVDPESMRRRLKLLIKSERFSEAAALVSVQLPDQGWVDVGIQVLAYVGTLSKAQDFLTWADENGDLNLRIRCAVAYADGCLARIFKNRGEPKFLLPEQINTDERSEVENAISHLQLAFDAVRLSRQVSTELEATALNRRFSLQLLAGDRSGAVETAEQLIRRIPIPIRAAEAVLQGLIPCTPEAPTRLRDEHRSIRAQVLACLLEARFLGKTADAFINACKLRDAAKLEEEKNSVAELVWELANRLDSDEAYSTAETVINQLLPPESVVRKLIAADRCLRQKKIEEATELIDSIDDRGNSHWLQMHAELEIQAGRIENALVDLRSVVSISPSPEIYWKIANLAQKLGHAEEHVSALHLLLSLEPENINARRRLANGYSEARQFSDAAEQYRRLCESTPTDPIAQVNFAISLSFQGKTAEALSVLKAAHASRLGDMAVPITYAKLLTAEGQGEEAFVLLQEVRAEYWENPEFVLVYMNVCYASGHEQEAQEALVQINQYRDEGKLGNDVIKAVPLDDIVELMKQDRERADALLDQEMLGRVPWTLVAEGNREVPYWAWHRKTQNLKFNFENPKIWTSRTIYATNHYRIFESQDGGAELVELQAPPANSAVVADITALITLHRLGLIETALQYFGSISVPYELVAKHVEEKRRLIPHQYSQVQNAEILKKALDDRLMSVFAKDEFVVVAKLNEYTEEVGDERLYKIIDLIAVLHSNGKISDCENDRLTGIVRRNGHDAESPTLLSLGQKVQTDVLTLNSIIGMKLFENFIENFQVYISADSEIEIMATIGSYAMLETTRRQYEDLWSKLKDARFTHVSVAASPAFVSSEDRRHSSVALSASELALSKRLPLLADDRVCQMLILNDRKDDACAAFGTDVLLDAFVSAGLLSESEAADKFLELVKWRYKFLVPSRTILGVIARRFVGNPPGNELRTISRYVHSSMRDPGLFTGFEPTSPPSQIALRLYRGWTEEIIGFVTDIWLDSDLSDDSVKGMTDWAIQECLPSVPMNLPQDVHSLFSSLLPRLVMTMALINTSRATRITEKRANSCLRYLASLLGCEDRYIDYLAEVAHA